MSFTSLLAAHGFDQMRLLRHPKAGFELRIARTFDPGIDWSVLGCDLWCDRLPCEDPITLGDRAARDLFRSADLADDLWQLEAEMDAGGHELLIVDHETRLGLTAALAVHSSRLGARRGRHALRAGGVRLHSPREPQVESLKDALRLARAMSYKNTAAELPVGGAKMVVVADRLVADDLPRLGFIARCIESGRFLAGPDVGFGGPLIDAIRAHFSRHIVGGSEGPSGGTNGPTAIGCFAAMEEAARHVFGPAGLHGRTVALQGLGGVGSQLAGLLSGAGARLVAADPDEQALRSVAARIGSFDIVAPAQILTTECDLLSPCALGPVVSRDLIPELRCRMIYGAANNQLAATSTAEELGLAEQLAQRGILFQVEWTYNFGGVIAGVDEYPTGGTPARALEATITELARRNTREILAEAARTGRTPTAVAYDRVARRLAQQR